MASRHHFALSSALNFPCLIRASPWFSIGVPAQLPGHHSSSGAGRLHGRTGSCHRAPECGGKRGTRASGSPLCCSGDDCRAAEQGRPSPVAGPSAAVPAQRNTATVPANRVPTDGRSWAPNRQQVEEQAPTRKRKTMKE